MPPRLRLRSLAQLVDIPLQRTSYVCSRCQYATAVTVPAPSHDQLSSPMTAMSPRYSPLQPPSHRSPAYRKSQLLRAYVSLLQSTPLIVLFQHNNLKAMEWAGIRRELTRALDKVDDQLCASSPDATPMGPAIKFQVVKPTILEPALRVAEYYNPIVPSEAGSSATEIQDEKHDPAPTHALSEAAYTTALEHMDKHPLTPLLTGSLALLTFPSVSPPHLKAALSILTPTSAALGFPAPTRRTTPSLYALPVQDGLKKLILLGARVDGQIFDLEGTRWMGSIDGGIDGLRAQLVALLQGAGVGLSRTLEMAGQNLWFTMESRRQDMGGLKEEKKEEEGTEMKR